VKTRNGNQTMPNTCPHSSGGVFIDVISCIFLFR